MTRTYRSTQKLDAVAELLLQRLPLTLAAFLLLAAIAINFANVLARYLFLASIYWADEAMVFLVIWSIFLAAVAVTYDGSHLTMDLFSTRLRRAGSARSIPRSRRSASRPSRSWPGKP